jgi:rhamnosyl/mannosyltransferase
MKILHVYKDYHPIPGGIEGHIRVLAELQAGQGHQVSVLVTNPGGEAKDELINGVQVHRASRLASVASTPLSLTLPFILGGMRPDITHLHFPYPIGEISQLALGRAPHVITYHSDVVRQQSLLKVYNPLLRRVLTRAARIMPTSAAYIPTSPYLAPLADRCTVVPLSVDAAAFENAPPLVPPTQVPTLLFMGRHRHYKGVDQMIQAMPGLAARFLIAGTGPLTAEWQALAEQLGVADRVQFVGFVPDADLAGFYASGDIFVLPANSRAEAFGIVSMEAMAAGLPVITTEVGSGTSFVVQDGQTGMVVPALDPAALAGAVQQLLDDPERRKSMGRAGRARVTTEFTPARLLQRVMTVYEQVLAQGATQGRST